MGFQSRHRQDEALPREELAELLARDYRLEIVRSREVLRRAEQVAKADPQGRSVRRWFATLVEEDLPGAATPGKWTQLDSSARMSTERGAARPLLAKQTLVLHETGHRAEMAEDAGLPDGVGPRAPDREAPRLERLGPGLRWRTDRAFDYDFSGVRIWRNGPLATGSTRALMRDGEAHFRASAYQPDTPEGDRLIAHELAHVVPPGGRAIGLCVQPAAAYAFDEGEDHGDHGAAALDGVLHSSDSETLRPALRALLERRFNAGLEIGGPRTSTVMASNSPAVNAPVAASGGPDRLPAPVEEQMSAAFGVDFSPVRVHQNSADASRARALALTRGADIHFASGAYQPESRQGRELIGHELAHVVQQAQGRVHGQSTADGGAVNREPALEREADEQGARAARGEFVNPGPVGALVSGGVAQYYVTTSDLSPRDRGKRFKISLWEGDVVGRFIRAENFTERGRVSFVFLLDGGQEIEVGSDTEIVPDGRDASLSSHEMDLARDSEPALSSSRASAPQSSDPTPPGEEGRPATGVAPLGTGDSVETLEAHAERILAGRLHRALRTAPINEVDRATNEKMEAPADRVIQEMKLDPVTRAALQEEKDRIASSLSTSDVTIARAARQQEWAEAEEAEEEEAEEEQRRAPDGQPEHARLGTSRWRRWCQEAGRTVKGLLGGRAKQAAAHSGAPQQTALLTPKLLEFVDTDSPDAIPRRDFLVWDEVKRAIDRCVARTPEGATSTAFLYELQDIVKLVNEASPEAPFLSGGAVGADVWNRLVNALASRKEAFILENAMNVSPGGERRTYGNTISEPETELCVRLIEALGRSMPPLNGRDLALDQVFPYLRLASPPGQELELNDITEPFFDSDNGVHDIGQLTAYINTQGRFYSPHTGDPFRDDDILRLFEHQSLRELAARLVAPQLTAGRNLTPQVANWCAGIGFLLSPQSRIPDGVEIPPRFHELRAEAEQQSREAQDSESYSGYRWSRAQAELDKLKNWLCDKPLDGWILNHKFHVWADEQVFLEVVKPSANYRTIEETLASAQDSACMAGLGDTLMIGVADIARRSTADGHFLRLIQLIGAYMTGAAPTASDRTTSGRTASGRAASDRG